MNGQFLSNDRRSMNRYKGPENVEVVLYDQLIPQTVKAKIINISENGLTIELEYIINKNDFKLTLYLPYPYDPINIDSKIVWKKKNESPYIAYGIQFVNLGNDDLLLKDYLAQDFIIKNVLQDRRRIDRRNVPLNRLISASGFFEKRNSERRQQFVSYNNVNPYSSVSQFIKELMDEQVDAPITGESPSINVPLREFALLIGGRLLRTGKEEYFPYVEKIITDFETTRKIISDIKKGILADNYREYVYAKYSVGKLHTNLDAIEAAYEAGQIYRSFPLIKRHKILLDIHKLLLDKKKELIDLMVIEGHPIRLAEWEFGGMEKSMRPPTLNFYKNEMLKELGKDENEFIYQTRRPDGVVCVSPPKNAPCSISILAALSLLSGNSMIIKPPLRSPIACMYLWQDIINKAAELNGAPHGIINVILGHSETIMKEWLESPKTNDIFFFGDSKMGLEIGVEAYKSGKKPILELSGNDFMVIWEDAPIEEAANALLEGFLGSMQICMAPKKALIHPQIYKNFLELFLKKVQEKVKVGLPSDPHTYLTPVARIKEFRETLELSLSLGAKLLNGGKRVDYKGYSDPKGHFIEATVIAIIDDDPLRFNCVAEENFFPLMPLITMRSSGLNNENVFQWMTHVINRNNYGLRTSVWTKSKRWATQFAQNIDTSGMVRVNSSHLAFSLYLPLNGGVRRSGGPLGEMNYPWLKTSHLQGVSIKYF